MNSEDILPESATPQSQPVTERTDGRVRRTADRRTFTWRTVVYSLTSPRRKRPNRAADQRAHHVDFHPRSTVWFSAGIMVLTAMDASLMLYFHDLGLRQLNGFVATLMESGRGLYVGVKIVGTGACLLLVAAVSSLEVFRLVPARYLFLIIFFGYLAYILNLLRYFL